MFSIFFRPRPPYGQVLQIQAAQGLSKDEQEVERRFATELEADVERSVRRYWNQVGHTRVLNTDEARELCARYKRSKESRARWSTATQEPAGALIKYLYQCVLKDETLTAYNTVVFLAGGGGSGKTSAFLGTPYGSDLVTRARLVYDTTMASCESSERKVKDALRAGCGVVIAYVHRPIENATRGVIQRALDTGRVVPSERLARDHYGSQRTILTLAERFRSNLRVAIQVIDNSGAPDEQETSSLDFLRSQVYPSVEHVLHRVEKVVQYEYERAREEGGESEFPSYVQQGLRGSGLRR